MTKNEKLPNTDTLTIRYNLDPKRTHEKADFQHAVTKDEKFPNIDTLAIEHKPEKTNELDHNQYEQTGDQSPDNIQERLVHNDELVDRSQSRTNVRILGRNERN